MEEVTPTAVAGYADAAWPLGIRAAAILADAAWPYATWSPRGQGRSASRHYATEEIEKKTLPVAAYAARDCWLFKWCPCEWRAFGEGRAAPPAPVTSATPKTASIPNSKLQLSEKDVGEEIPF